AEKVDASYSGRSDKHASALTLGDYQLGTGCSTLGALVAATYSERNSSKQALVLDALYRVIARVIYQKSADGIVAKRPS
ncbi:hypothetical protein, partial [Klebsiella pneumoniae]|uniref:hypothetical protein n=3 Tax=Klebsiella TaxID=570 RepID=UPI00350F91B6